MVTALTSPSGSGSGSASRGVSPSCTSSQPLRRLLHALERHLVAHRVLAEDDRQAGFDERLGQPPGARRRDHRVVGAVLEQHRDVARTLEVDAEQTRRHERAHGQHARRTGPLRWPEPERQRQTGALREPADDGLGAVEPVLLARGVEQVVDRGERGGEGVGDLVGILGAEVEPREPGRRGDGAARQHRREACRSGRGSRAVRRGRARRRRTRAAATGGGRRCSR